MKTENHSIHDVLAKNATSFFIPPFQRAYAWGKSEIGRFFSDISRLIDSELDLNQHNKLEHFFGTLVIKEEKTGFANKSIIIDGQQRLTTTLLFLIALRDIEKDSNNQDRITQTYLINSTSDFQDKIKLKQVTKDWDSYRALINRNSPIPGLITNSYSLLKKLIEQKKNSTPAIQLDHFIIALQRMNVAVIFLDERPYKGEDPQIIYETLNSLGKPLLLSDLVRNFILLNLKSKDQTEIFESIWHPKIENVLLDKSSEFFRDYLQYKMQKSLKVVSDNNTKELYQEFKDYVEKNFVNRNDFIQDIVKYVLYYNWIITEEIPYNEKISNNEIDDLTIKELLRNIFHDIKSEAFKPFVLGLLEYHQNKKMNDNTLIETLKTIRTYLIRRRILGLTQGENKNIVLLCNKIEDIANQKLAMIDILTNLFYKLRLPNDIEVKHELETMNFYEELKNYSKFILGKIEENNSKVSVNFRSKEITIEHIMPQKLDINWKKELGENYDEIHKKYIHNIGNLILTEFNSENGNKPFEVKKKIFGKSNLFYRHDVVKKQYWNEQSIKEHQEKMIAWFLETFDLPEQYKKANNWKFKNDDTEYSYFSPLSEDAYEIVTGNKPVELIIFEKINKVESWQDVFLKFLNYLKYKSEQEFNFLIENQYEIFKKDDVFLNWYSLEKLIENNSDLINRYKTLDGKTCDKINNKYNDTIFIHINISASTCISRIANIMQKLFINEESVKIKLFDKSVKKNNYSTT